MSAVAERAEVVARLRAACEKAAAPAALAPGRAKAPTGFARLDAALGGGLQGGALNEVYVAAAGSGALEALLPGLARAGSARRLLAWIHPERTPYPPALAQRGLDLSRWLVVRPEKQDDHLWAFEQALRSGACDAALTFLADAGDRVQRRLQLAAEEGGTLGLVIRPAALAARASPAAVRLAAEPVRASDLGRRAVRFRILKCRGLPGLGHGTPDIAVEWRLDPLDGTAAS
jgi:hypothetical protein